MKRLAALAAMTGTSALASISPSDLGLGLSGRNLQTRDGTRGGRLGGGTAPRGQGAQRGANELVELHDRLDVITDAIAGLVENRAPVAPVAPAAPAAPAAVAPAAVAPAAPAIITERNAVLDAAAMRAFAADLNLAVDDGFVGRNAGITRDQFMERYTSDIVQRAAGLNQIGGMGVTNDVISERQARRQQLARAVEASCTPGQSMPSELAPEFGMRMGPADLLRQICRGYGIRYPDDPQNYMAFMGELRSVAPMVLQDFTAVANQVMGVRLISQMDEIQFAASEITAYMGMNGYMTNALATNAVWDPLKKLTPGGEIERGGINVFDLNAIIETGGRSYPIGRTLYATNPVGMFSDIPRKVLVAGRTYQNVMHRDKLKTNPRMSDKVPFWNEVRGNVIGNAGITPQGIAAAQAALVTDDLPIRGTILIVHPDDQFVADQIVAANTPATYNQVNPYSGRLKVVLFAGIEPGSFILAIDPTIRPFLLDLGMDSQPTPIIELVPTAQYDGFEIKVVWDKGAAYGDPRGAVLAFPGAIPETFGNGAPTLYLAEDALPAA